MDGMYLFLGLVGAVLAGIGFALKVERDRAPTLSDLSIDDARTRLD